MGLIWLRFGVFGVFVGGGYFGRFGDWASAGEFDLAVGDLAFGDFGSLTLLRDWKGCVGGGWA
jgi:hypothetical protein